MARFEVTMRLSYKEAMVIAEAVNEFWNKLDDDNAVTNLAESMGLEMDELVELAEELLVTIPHIIPVSISADN